MEAEVGDGTTRADQLQLPGIDADAQVAGIAPGEGGSIDDGTRTANCMLWELVLHPVEDAVVHGRYRGTAGVRDRHPIDCRHGAQSWAVLPRLNWSGE